MKEIDTVIFDLDGTLLDTIEDLTDSINHVLQETGFPPHTLEEVKGYVGNGLAKLAERALPANVSVSVKQEVTDRLVAYYTSHCQIKTKLYDGILPLLETLQQRQIKMAIVTNKNQEAASELGAIYFKDLIPIIVGAREHVAKKPAPDSVWEAIRELDATPESSIYVGDSEVDYATAQNAGLDAVLVSWGFRDRKILSEFQPLRVIDHPSELLELISEIR